MWSSEGKSNSNSGSGQQALITSARNWEQEREEIFQLIDSLLSFEACLYHQIVPFGLADNKLLLGMVHPQDSAALDYVRRILSYIKSTMVIGAIAADTHRSILSAYLNHKNTSRLDEKQVDQQAADYKQEKSANVILNQNNSSTTALPEKEQPASATKEQTQAPQFSKESPDFPPILNIDTIAQRTTLIPAANEQTEDTSNRGLPSHLTNLPLSDSEQFSSIEVLATLPPKKLFEELLRRVLSGGIGRLYLERQPYQGRILWSDNGVLQCVLENLPLSVFQGVLNELKRFAALPVTRVAEPKQVEKECLYQQNRLLFRLRLMPGIYGEEATLQVLRGTALKFYQQQQLVRLSNDALGISQQLSFKLHELHQRLILNPSLKSEQLEALVALNQLVENLDQQIKILTTSGELPIDS